MPNHSPIELERELHRRFGAWLADAEAIRAFCIDSGLSVPSIIGGIAPSQAPAPAIAKPPRIPTPAVTSKLPIKPLHPRLTHGFHIPSEPNYGERPSEAEKGWMPVPLGEASTANLILYILKKNGGTAPSTLLSVKLPQLRPASGASTLHMTLQKLHSEGRIRGDFREWSLEIEVQIELSASRMWCAVEQLRSPDRAAIRREVILAALKVNHLMSVATIADCLRSCEWLKGLPIDSNAVKADMRILARDKRALKEGTQWKLL